MFIVCRKASIKPDVYAMRIIYFLFVLSFNCLFAQEKISLMASERNIHLKNDEHKAMLEDLAFQLAFGNKPFLLDYQGLIENIDSTNAKQWIEVAKNSKFIEPLIAHLEPDYAQYSASLLYKFHPNYSRLTDYQNFFRWVNRFDHEAFVLINVPANTLTFYKDNQATLEMNVIVGTNKNKTPLMATEADALMLYPYWTATRNIAVNEILPHVKKDLAYLYKNNFEVLDANYNVISPSSVDWQSLNASNFNYKFRQGTGCDNSLGLLKINIKNPYSVYMHDVPHTEYSQSLFNRDKRFFSHGCIRLQHPLALANFLRPKQPIDQNLLEKCLINQKTTVIDLEKPIPIFIMYFTNYIDSEGKWKSVDDYYKRIKL
jgi:hypothetical protein